MRAAANPIRGAWALVFVLMLSLRLVGSAGFMPVVEQGSLAIVACPDAALNAPLALPAMHHHGQMQHGHEPCPYAAAGALGATDTAFVPILAILLVGMALLLGRTFTFVERQNRRDRPPAIGPPPPATI